MGKQIPVVTLICLLTACGSQHFGESGVGPVGGKADSPIATKAWTYLLYGAGDNNLADGILGDVNELESIGSSEEVNLVAFYDTPDGATIAYLERDEYDDFVSSPQASLGPADSGHFQTVSDVLRWAMANYPADNFALIIGGHGGGAPRIIAPDDSTGSMISVKQLGEALSFAPQRVNLLGADACLMQTIETAYELRHAVDVVVGSENVEPGEGWPHDRVAQALTDDPAMSARQLGRTIVQQYGQAYPSYGDVTLAAIDTAGVGLVKRRLSELGAGLYASIRESDSNREAIEQALAATWHFVTVFDDNTEYHDQFIDLRNFQDELSKRLPYSTLLGKMANVIFSVADALIESYVANDLAGRAFGVSVFFPQKDHVVPSIFKDYTAAYSLARESDWDGFLRNYYGLLQ
jgi:hypothetical protein